MLRALTDHSKIHTYDRGQILCAFTCMENEASKALKASEAVIAKKNLRLKMGTTSHILLPTEHELSLDIHPAAKHDGQQWFFWVSANGVYTSSNGASHIININTAEKDCLCRITYEGGIKSQERHLHTPFANDVLPAETLALAHDLLMPENGAHVGKAADIIAAAKQYLFRYVLVGGGIVPVQEAEKLGYKGKFFAAPQGKREDIAIG